MNIKPNISDILKKKSKPVDSNESMSSAEREFMNKSDDAISSKVDKYRPWKDPDLSMVFQSKHTQKNLPEIGTRTNIRCPEWHYEVSKWFAINSRDSPNTAHAVIIQAIGIGLEAMIEQESNKDDWE